MTHSQLYISLDMIREGVKFVINEPVWRKNNEFLKVDPFVLRRKTENMTNQMYRGPVQVVASNQSDCLHPLMESSIDQEVIIYPVNEYT